jgi:tetratricopeptide (TPR) repeat protein
LGKKEGKVKKPIHLLVGLALAVVALGLAVYFYFWTPTPVVPEIKPQVNDIVLLERSSMELVGKKRYDEAIAQLNKALGLSPGNSDLLMDRASVYYKQQNFEDALSDYQLALSNCANKENKALPGDNLNNASFGVALCQAALDRPEMAIKILHGIQARDAHFIKCYQLLGDIYLKTGDTEAALDAYTQGLRLNPKSSALRYDRAVAYLKREMKEQAFEDLSKAVELDKDSLPIRLKHANLAQKMGKLEVADNDAREILRLEPRNRSALAWLKKRNKSLYGSGQAKSGENTPATKNAN